MSGKEKALEDISNLYGSLLDNKISLREGIHQIINIQVDNELDHKEVQKALEEVNKKFLEKV